MRRNTIKIKIRVGNARIKRITLSGQDLEWQAAQFMRQLLPSIKTRAQVKRKGKSLAYLRAELAQSGKIIRRGKVKYRRHIQENPYDFRLSPESIELFNSLSETDYGQVFGSIFAPEIAFRPRKARRAESEKLSPSEERAILDSLNNLK